MVRAKYPAAWTYHRTTSRWPHNMHGLNDPTYETAPFKEYLRSRTVALPEPATPAATLAEVLAARRSSRRFTGEALPLAALSTVLHAGYGVIGSVDLGSEFLERPVPSGGGLYPLELYVLAQAVDGLDGGVYHYAPLGHLLEVVHDHPLPSLLTSELFLGQPYLAHAGALVVVTAVLERSLWKYEDRGYRYVLLEAGHVAQNMSLVAAALGLGCLNLGGFFDADVAALLRVDPDEEPPLYGFAVGATDEPDRALRRTPPGPDGAFMRF